MSMSPASCTAVFASAQQQRIHANDEPCLELKEVR